MPELPEVETIVRRLSQVLPGKYIDEVTVLHPKSFQGALEFVVGKQVCSVSRRAKLIRIQLTDNSNLLAHLKMTGQFIFIGADGARLGGGHPTADWVSELPSKHSRIQFSLSEENQEQSKLFFNDMRIFGWVKVATDLEVQKEFEKYGPDVHTQAATLEYFAEKLKKTNRNIKQVIMDNSIISGVGNIYACDGLHLAKIDPRRSANSLSKSEIEILLDSLKEVISLGIELGGATIDNYRTVDGFAGKYQEKVRVYGKEGEPCQNCSKKIQKIKIGGRGTYFCPVCQL